MDDLKPFGFVTFCYEGAPFFFKEGLSGPPSMQLFKLKHIARATTAFTSDDRELRSLQTYLDLYAEGDRAFNKRINFDSVRISSREDSSLPGERRQNDFESYIEWFCHEGCPREWGGLFSLKSTLTVDEWALQFDEMWPKIHHVLLMYHLELVSGYREYFNPYLNMDVFNESALSILEHLAQGESSKSIANSMGMSERGVEYHISQLSTKLGAKNRIQLVHIATKLGIL